MKTTTTSPFKAIGRLMVERGYSVIPISPPDCGIQNAGKCPGQYIDKRWKAFTGWNRYQDKAPNDVEISMFNDYQDAGIGLLLGAVSGVVAVDFDYDVDGMHAQIQDALPASPIIKTGAKGYTAFYQCGEEKYRGWEKDGKTVVEILSYGRQTVIPDSIHPLGMPYRWTGSDTFLTIGNQSDLPAIPDGFVAWMDELFQVPQEEQWHPSTSNGHSGNGYNHSGLPPSSPEKVREALTYIDSGEYSQWTDVGFALHDYFGDAGFELWDEWSQSSPKYYDKTTNTKRKWRTFRQGGGKSISYVFMLAMARGFVNTPEYEQPVPVKHSFTVNGKAIGEVSKQGAGNKAKKNNIQIITPEERSRYKNPTFDSEYHQLCFDAPGGIGDVVKWISDSAPYPQPIISLAAAIPFFGLLKAHRVKSPTGLRTNMYTMGVAPSGQGKNHPIGCLDTLASELNLLQHLGGVPSSAAGLLTSMSAGEGRSLIKFDEFGRILQAAANPQSSSHLYGLVTVIMELFSRADGIRRGAEYANRDGKNDRVDIDQPCLNLFAATVADNLYSSLNETALSDGFLNRWLVFESDDYSYSTHHLLASGKVLPDTIKDQLMEWRARPTNCDPKGNLDKAIRPDVMTFSGAAASGVELFGIDAKIMCKRYNDKGSKLGYLYTRAQEHAIKLAMVGSRGMIITADEFDWAIRVTRWCIDMMTKAVETHISSNKTEADTKKVLNIIKDTGEKGILKRDLTRKTQFLQGKRRMEILQDLVESNQVEVYQNPEDRKDRQKVVYKFINS